MPYMGYLKQSTAVTKTVLMVDSTDHISGKTGLTITKYLTKAGGTPAATTITTSELNSTETPGIYSLAFASTDVDTLGDLQLHLTATGADPADYWWTVTARLLDDLAYPATSGRSMVVDANGLVDANTVKVGPTGNGTAQTARDIGASVLLSNGTGAGQIALSSGAVTVGTNNDKTGYAASTVSDKSGYSLATPPLASTDYTAPPSAATIASQVRTELGTELGRIDVAISSRLASTDYIALASTDYTAPPSAATIASQVRTELTTELGRVDVAVSSRLASTDYTAPDNASITAIKNKTDNLPSDPADESALEAAIAALNNLSSSDITAAVPTAGVIASQVRTELTTELGRVDVAISSRLASTDYVSPLSSSDIPTVADIADGVWDEAVADHLGAGSAGNALNAAGSAGDPWSTAIPGAYGAGTAGNILGNYVDIAISSRLASTDYTAPDNAGISAIQAKTNNLSTDPADESTLEAAIAALNNLSSSDITAAVPTAAQISTQILTDAQTTPIESNVKQVNDTPLTGNGQAATPWGPA